MSLKTLRVPLLAILAVVLVVGASAWLATSFGNQSGATHGQAAAKSPPPLSEEMLATLTKQGVLVTPDRDGTEAQREALDKAISIAADSFNFADPEKVAGVSLATTTVTDRKQIKDRRMWVVYLTGVDQPVFGPAHENNEGEASQDIGANSDMYVLVDAETMDFISAGAF
jgi:hypothetical protein